VNHPILISDQEDGIPYRQIEFMKQRTRYLITVDSSKYIFEMKRKEYSAYVYT